MGLIRTIGLQATVLALAAGSTSALADDPLDPAMDEAAIARDREIIRKLNRDMLAQVQARDRAYAKGWKDYARAKTDPRYGPEHYERRLADFKRTQSRYAQDRRQYEKAMADWRNHVSE
ncbi:MAG: hypothetical protein KUG65_09695 [Sphingomonadaceae bacterium]|nr:hypothetical protein [Sphingomonadaceae bacterium]